MNNYGICEDCHEPIQTGADTTRGWTHSTTGNYRCPNGGGYAAPLEGDTFERGYEVVQLPKPTRHTDNTAQWDDLYWSVIRNVGVVISDVAHLQSFSPDEARSLAAALLAAAAKAEEGK